MRKRFQKIFTTQTFKSNRESLLCTKGRICFPAYTKTNTYTHEDSKINVSFQYIIMVYYSNFANYITKNCK